MIGATHRLAAGIAAALTLLVCQLAAAGVAVQVDERGRVQVTADQASNRAILESLSEKLDFAVIVEDAEWSAQVRRFERSGPPEKVLKALLGNTNHLLSYRGDTVAGVTVLAEGAGGAQMLISKPSSGPVAVDGRESIGKATPRETDVTTSAPHWKRGGRQITNTPQDTAEEETEVAGTVPEPTPVSSLLQRRAQAAAQYNNPPPASQSQENKVPVMEPPVHEGIPAGIDLAELARLTQQAHQDVQNMAEQLRRAEAQMKANQPQ